MAGNSGASSPRRSLEFVDSAKLDILIPDQTDADIEEILRSSSTEAGTDESILPSVNQRSLLYFDELVSVYIVLQTPLVPENTLKSYLSRLAISLDVHVVSPPSQQAPKQQSHAKDAEHRPSAPQKDLIHSGTVEEDEDPYIIIQGQDESDKSSKRDSILVVWKIKVPLNRPRIRIARPSITFSTTANLRPAETAPSDVRAEEFLPSGVPAAVNLLGAFRAEPSLAEVKPYLSATRVSRVVPISPTAKELLRPVQSRSPKSFAAIPAANARIRHGKLNTYTRKPTVVASLDFDVTPLMECPLRLDSVNLELLGGTVEELSTSEALNLPLTCKARDNVTFLYRFSASEDIDPNARQTSDVRAVDISIKATVLVSESCQPPIHMRWRSNVDFSSSLNPAFGGPGKAMQRDRRPSSLNKYAPGNTQSQDGSKSASRPESVSSETAAVASATASRDRTQSTPLHNLGLTVTFTGPPEVYVGEPFRWEVFVVNHSERSRKLALVVVTRRRNSEVRKTHSRPLSSGSAAKRKEIADAYMDENVLYAMQRGSIVEPTELVNLSSEVRIGPLPPSACHVTDLRLLPVATGILHVEAIRIVDLSSQHAVDVRDLPCIISRLKTPRASGGSDSVSDS